MRQSHRSSLIVLTLSALIHGGLLWGTCVREPAVPLQLGRQPIHLSILNQSARGGVSREQPSLSASKTSRISTDHIKKMVPWAATASSPAALAPSRSWEIPDNQSAAQAMSPETVGSDAAPSSARVSGDEGGASADHSSEGPIDLGEANARGTLGPYEAQLLTLISKYEYYPKNARMRRIEGEVVLLISIAPDGVLTNANIHASSGFVILDQTSLEIVHAAAPFPPPATFGLGARTYLIPFVFRLHS